MSKKKVIILGGGVAGLSAAHELIKRNFDVEVFESKDIAGGKARSVPVPGTGKDGRKDLPGEHGFRFFPRFYKHIIATIKEIPYEKGSVYDNLVETTQIKMARFGKESIVMPSRFPRSLKDFEEILDDAFDSNLGLTHEDKKYFAERVWQLITSCKDRRLNEYESLGWWEFLDASNHSEAYQTFFAKGLTRTLVAARADTASTKTGGDIFVQLIFDIAIPGVSSDRILNGPTNEVWINPWLKFLRDKGVKYHFNAPLKQINADKHQITSVEILQDGEVKTHYADYYISCLPIDIFSKFITPALINIDPTLTNIQTLASSVAWMNGAQYYLNTEVNINHGHTIYVDTPWALTSISQKQFWNIDLNNYGAGNVKGILSIDISDWTTPGILIQKPANVCTREEILKEIWYQLKLSLNVEGEVVLKDEYLIHSFLDPDIVIGDGQNYNEEPLLVNTVNSWYLRPFAYTRVPNLFLASDYVKTNTDLATMEGANEAARRAVNCIIDVSNSPATKCEIWELYEPAIFDIFRWKDKQRYKKGLPWAPNLPWWVNLLKDIRVFFAKSLNI